MLNPANAIKKPEVRKAEQVEKEEDESGEGTGNKGLVANPKALSLARQLMSN